MLTKRSGTAVAHHLPWSTVRVTRPVGFRCQLINTVLFLRLIFNASYNFTRLNRGTGHNNINGTGRVNILLPIRTFQLLTDLLLFPDENSNEPNFRLHILASRARSICPAFVYREKKKKFSIRINRRRATVTDGQTRVGRKIAGRMNRTADACKAYPTGVRRKSNAIRARSSGDFVLLRKYASIGTRVMCFAKYDRIYVFRRRRRSNGLISPAAGNIRVFIKKYTLRRSEGCDRRRTVVALLNIRRDMLRRSDRQIRREA